MRSIAFSLSRSSKILLVENSLSRLSVRMLAVSSYTLKMRSGWSTSSGLLTVINPFFFSISFSKKLIKVPPVSLSGLNSFFNYDKTTYSILPSANLQVCLVTSLINCAVFSIPSGVCICIKCFWQVRVLSAWHTLRLFLLIFF